MHGESDQICHDQLHFPSITAWKVLQRRIQLWSSMNFKSQLKFYTYSIPIAVVLFLIYWNWYGNYVNTDQRMSLNIHRTGWLEKECAPWSLRNLKYGDLILWREHNDLRTLRVSRIVAFAGDKVEIKNSVFFLNQERKTQPEIQEKKTIQILRRDREFTIFREHSKDFKFNIGVSDQENQFNFAITVDADRILALEDYRDYSSSEKIRARLIEKDQIKCFLKAIGD
jgi:hypothetical protein